MHPFDVLGVIGVCLILTAYGLLQLGRLRPDMLAHPVMNLLGATLILISLTRTFNLASAVIEIAWIAISLFGIYRIAARRKIGPQAPKE